jgi:hypothetical protein
MMDPCATDARKWGLVWGFIPPQAQSRKPGRGSGHGLPCTLKQNAPA